MDFSSYLDAILTPHHGFTLERIGMMLHQSSWGDIVQKALRLMNNGQVTILRNTPTHILGHVVGDHGEYESEISRHDPTSNIIEQWQCTCPWDQFAWDRTRQFKYLEGRVCSHVLGTYWRAKGTPLDTEEHPDFQVPIGQKAMPTAPPGQTQLFDPNQAPTQPTTQDLTIPQQPAIVGPAGTPIKQAPVRPKKVLQPLQLFDITAPPVAQQPVLTPTSVPGGAPPTPGNPISIPGSFSKFWIASKRPIYSANFEDWLQSQLDAGQNPVVQIVGPDVEIELRGGKIPMPGAQPSGMHPWGIPLYKTKDLGYDPESNARMNADETNPMGPGAPEQRGEHIPIPLGSVGEVTSFEGAPLNMAYVQVHLKTPALHPHLAAGWIEFRDLKPVTRPMRPFRPARGSANQIMYHLTRKDFWPQIQRDGLVPNSPESMFTQAGTWADKYYGARPIYLSTQPGKSNDTDYMKSTGLHPDYFVMLEVNTNGLDLVADLPGLYDSGASLEEDAGMWYNEGYEPPALKPFEDDQGIISFEDLLGPASPAAIEVTGTAACLSPITPDRLRLVNERISVTRPMRPSHPKSKVGMSTNPYQFIADTTGSQWDGVNFIWPNGNKVALDLDDQGDTITINNIRAEPVSAGLGKRVIQSLQQFANQNGQSIRAQEVLAPEFFNQMGFVEDDDPDNIDEWQEAPDYWWHPTEVD